MTPEHITLLARGNAHGAFKLLADECAAWKFFHDDFETYANAFTAELLACIDLVKLYGRSPPSTST